MRTLRRLGLSQRRLALRIGVDVGTVNRWATGRSPIPGSVLLLLECWSREQRRLKAKSNKNRT